jgi:hypothetical protein
MQPTNLKRESQGGGRKRTNRAKQQNSLSVGEEDEFSNEFLECTNKEVEEFRIKKDTTIYYLNKFMVNYKGYTDETNVELEGKFKIDQENESYEEGQFMNILPNEYAQDDDEVMMDKKDLESKARRMQRVGIIRFCYQQVEKELSIEDKEFIRNYVKNTEGVDSIPEELEWNRMIEIRQRVQTAINLELGRRNKIRRRKEYRDDAKKAFQRITKPQGGRCDLTQMKWQTIMRQIGKMKQIMKEIMRALLYLR